MDQKTNLRIPALLLCLFLSGMLLWNLFSPGRDFSDQENRVLASFPAFSIDSLLSGKFTGGVETYLTDQFAGRDGWVALKAFSEFALGQREFNGLYLAGDRLIPKVDAPDPDRLLKNLSAVEALRTGSGIPVYSLLVPSPAAVYADSLPSGAPSYDESDLTGALLDMLRAHKDEYIYFRTDHHWTQRGAYYGYAALMESMGITPQPLPAESVLVSGSFNGTSYSRSGVRWLAPDSIEVYVPDPGVTVRITEGAETAAGSLYDEAALATKDKYAYFLGGNHAVAVVETGNAGPKLLLIRDSYADILVPWLLPHFSKIHLLDLRYVKESVLSYIEEHEIDQAAVLYGVSNFISDPNLFLMGR